MTMGGDSMSLPVAQKAATRKYGATWTRKTPTLQVIYENTQRNAGELKLLQLPTKQKMQRRLVLQ